MGLRAFSVSWTTKTVVVSTQKLRKSGPALLAVGARAREMRTVARSGRAGGGGKAAPKRLRLQ